MKKFVSVIFVIAMILAIAAPAVSAAEITYNTIDEHTVSVTMTPFRATAYSITTEESDELSGMGTCTYTNMYGYKGIQLGDADKDGELTINDVTLIQKYIADSTELDSLAQHNADIDFDRNVTIDDVTILQEAIATL